MVMTKQRTPFEQFVFILGLCALGILGLFVSIVLISFTVGVFLPLFT